MQIVCKKKLIVISFGLICLFLIIGASFLLLRRGNGTRLTPAVTTSPPVSDTFYQQFSQNDPEWAQDRLGGSSDTMAQSGCLTCCIAASLTAQQAYEDSPGQLNALFSSHNVYNESGAILWNQLSQALPGITIQTDGQLSSQSIDKLLEEGIFPIVKVRRKSGAFHWVTLMEANAAVKSYTCLDPLDGKISLAEYENRIYAVRILSAD